MRMNKKSGTYSMVMNTGLSVVMPKILNGDPCSRNILYLKYI